MALQCCLYTVETPTRLKVTMSCFLLTLSPISDNLTLSVVCEISFHVVRRVLGLLLVVENEGDNRDRAGELAKIRKCGDSFLCFSNISYNHGEKIFRVQRRHQQKLFAGNIDNLVLCKNFIPALKEFYSFKLQDFYWHISFIISEKYFLHSIGFILRRCRKIFTPIEHSTSIPANCRKDFLSIFFVKD
uniref:Secreted protein n=1 Tax=Strongyloides venezuelensis TaxID=75913 RepID=A0A0K0FQD1_STRVS